MTAPLTISPLACWLIGLYQRYLSPYKGFRCAYRARHKRRASCSAFARRAIERLGLLPGVRLLRRRFDKCHHAAKVLEYETPRKEEQRQNQSASVADCVPDCGGCDPGAIDACDVISDATDAVSGCDAVPIDACACDLSP
jgi:uncharacterized protein